MRNEIWRNGELIEVIELPQEVEIDVDVTIPATALEALKADLQEVNTIAKLKVALTTFVEKLDVNSQLEV